MTIFQNIIFSCKDSRIDTMIFIFLQAAYLYFCSLFGLMCFKTRLLSREKITSSLVARWWDCCCYMAGILPLYALQIHSTLYLHSTFNFFKACLRLSCLQFCGVGSMSFSTHLLQARTMSHREVKWWVGGGSTSPPAHAAFPSCVKLCGHRSSTGTNMSQTTPVWLLTTLWIESFRKMGLFWESLFMSPHVLSTLLFRPCRWASFHNDLPSSH